MSRQPIVGGDSGTWGTVLNDYLSVSLNTDGTLKTAYVTPTSNQLDGTEKRVLSVQPTNASGSAPLPAGSGPFVLSFVDNPYATTDPSMAIGYNQTAGGALITASENAFSWFVEANYNDGSGHNKMETYSQYTSSSGLVGKRPIMFQFQRDNDALTTSLLMGTAGTGVTITADDGTVSGVAVANITKSGMFFSPSGGLGTHTAQLIVNATAVIYMFDTPNGSAGAAIAVGVFDNSAVGMFANSGAVGVKGLVVRSKVGQTGNMFDIQDQGSVPRIFVTAATTALAPSLVVGSAALATTATDGFLYLPTCAGVPTGVPTTRTGTAPIVIDTTDNKIYVYNGGWKSVLVA